MTITRRVKNNIMRCHNHHKSRTTSLLFMVKNKKYPLNNIIHAKNAFIIYVAYGNNIPLSPIMHHLMPTGLLAFPLFFFP